MNKQLVLIYFLFLCTLGFSQVSTEYTHYSKLMGSTFTITIIDSTTKDAQQKCLLAEEFGKKIESEISSWDSNSFTSSINRNAGVKPVIVPQHLYLLIQRALKISALTDGAFDISYAALDGIWDFSSKSNPVPSQKAITNATAKVNYKNIILNPLDSSVYLTDTGMKIGFGAIGKGYLADEVSNFLKSKGIRAGIVNAGGDLIAWGAPRYDTAWEIGLANPKLKNSVLGKLKLNNQAMVTSGDYEKYIELDGIKYAHILNPKTGMPVDFLNSVSVLCSSAELADALATAIFVMGPKKGLNLMDKLNGIEAVTIKNNEILSSQGISINQIEQVQITGILTYFADYASLKLCGQEKILPLDLGKNQINIEKKYFQLSANKETVYAIIKGYYKTEKRGSKSKDVFHVTQMIQMQAGLCP